MREVILAYLFGVANGFGFILGIIFIFVEFMIISNWLEGRK